MEWKKLNRESLEQLKKINNEILVGVDDDEFPYDITHFIDLTECGLDDSEMKYHWASLMHRHSKNGYTEYNDDDILCWFSHYYILEKPKKGSDKYGK